MAWLSIVRDVAKNSSLGVKPLLDGGSIGWGTTLNIRDTDRIDVSARKGKRPRVYPLLLPLTLCSENVMSL